MAHAPEEDRPAVSIKHLRSQATLALRGRRELGQAFSAPVSAFRRYGLPGASGGHAVLRLFALSRLNPH